MYLLIYIFDKIVNTIKKYPLLFSFPSGLLAKLAFSSGEHVITLVLSVEIFYIIIHHLHQTKSYKSAFFAGYMYGLGLYAGIMYWETYLHGDINIGGISPTVLKISFYILSIMYVAIYYAIASYISVKIAVNKLSLLLLFAVLVTAFEIVQCRLFDGFPMVILAYGTNGLPYFPNIASIVGSYGVTFLFLFILSLLNVKKTFICGLLLLFSILGYNFYQVNYGKNYRQQQSSFEVTVIQPNFSYKNKQHRDYKTKCDTVARLADINNQSTNDKIRLIITPENIIQCRRRQIKYFNQSLLKHKDVYVMTGFLETVKNKNNNFTKSNSVKYNCYNTVHVYAMDQNSSDPNEIKYDDIAHYRKKHMIPFVEHIPEWCFDFAELLPDNLAEKIIGLKDNMFSAGKDKNTIKLSGIDQFDMNTCYDIITPGESMDDKFLSTWMLNIINLYNYCSEGISDLAHQHNVMCQFRAMEFGKPMAVCANYGISCFIDCNGYVIQQLAPTQQGALHQHFPIKYRTTPFCMWGNNLIYFILILLLMILVIYSFKMEYNNMISFQRYENIKSVEQDGNIKSSDQCENIKSVEQDKNIKYRKKDKKIKYSLDSSSTNSSDDVQ